MFTDLRQAIRLLLKNAGFSAIVVGVLAVGIGATTAIFSIVNGVLLKPLPFADSGRLLAIACTTRTDTSDDCSYPDIQDWRAQSKSLDRVAAYVSMGTVALTGRGETTSLQIVAVTSDLFPMLGAAPLRGRAFTDVDDGNGAEPVVVLSESAWTSRFHREPSILGEHLTLEGKSYTIVGVMPAAVQFPIQAEQIDAWMPINAFPLAQQFAKERGAMFANAIGRLAPERTVDQANAELRTMAAGLAATYPKTNVNRGAVATPLQRRMVRDYRTGLVVLLCAVAAVLLIACANVANLLLARATVRERELAIRAAIGASRARLLRQLLTESLTLALVAGAFGAIFAMWAVSAVVAASPVDIPRLKDVVVDRSALFFTTAISIVTGVLFGLAPAFHLSRADSAETMKDTGRGSSGSRSARTRAILVVGEVALSLLLLACAGLLVRSLVALQHVDPGFVTEHAITTEMSLPAARYPDEAAMVRFYERLREGLTALPGVAAISTTMPLSGNHLGVGFTIDGRPVDPQVQTSATFYAVSPAYFTAMGVRLIKGRVFTDHDTVDAPSTIVVSEAMAQRYWPGEDPLGKRVTIGYNRTGPRQVVGVVSDVKSSGLAERPDPQMYTPYPQAPWPFMAVVLRTTGDPQAASGALRSLLVRIDPDQSPPKIRTMTEYVAKSIATPRFMAALVASFAALALLLAGFGLFSVMAYSVAQRRREIGIRVALGATPSDVRSLIVSQAARMGAAGVVLGLAAALAATRLLGSLLFQVNATDPATFGAVCGLLFAVLLLAAYLPAVRASRVEPNVALRTE